MKKSFQTIVLLVFLKTLIVNPVFCQDENGNTSTSQVNTVTTAVPFLMINPDARSGGLGGAGVSSTPDVYSMQWNPAKYAFIEDNGGFALSYTPWLRNLNNDLGLFYLNGYFKVSDKQTIASSLRYFALGETQFFVPMGVYKPRELALDVAYSIALSEYFATAIALRYIYSDLTQGQVVGGGTIANKPGQALAFDIATYYNRKLPWELPIYFALGLNISNIGNKISYTDDIKPQFLPTNLRLGPSLTVKFSEANRLSFMVDMNKLLVPTPNHERMEEINDMSVFVGMLNSFSTAPGGISEHMNEIKYAFGVEYRHKHFAVRQGYFHEHRNKGNRKFLTFGAGVYFGVFSFNLSYLYPIGFLSPLQNTIAFSLGFNF